MATEKEDKFVNPFEVSYAEFEKALGKKSVKDYAKGHLTDVQIEQIEKDLQLLNN